ncbi:unnamed protein product [Prorocentrum cordatum]|uniref:Uncharacterized protein n=1 Tax=Prorocentrum cordatum TaxID=2364126 RepID=A0ABN9VXC3_9DINO|nr:unnamed protein product [Polarella glacialis]
MYMMSFSLEAEQKEYFATLFVRSCVSVSCCTLAAHAWFGYDDCLASLAKLKRALESLFVLPDAGASFDARVLNEFNHARVTRAQYVSDAVFIPFSVILLPLVICVHATSASDWDVVFRAAFMLARHWATLYWKYLRKSCGFTTVEIELLYKMFMLFLAVRTHLADTQRILMYGGILSAARGCLVALLLDCKTTVRWNAFLSAVTCFTFWRRREELCIDGISSMAVFVHHFLIEVGICMLICSASIFLELGEKERVKASTESSQSSRAHRAVQRLLGVFCDAHLHICQSCNIISHSPPLLHLLGGSEDGTGGTTTSTLAGSNFLRYVGESDQQRFQDWLSSNGAAVSMAEDPSSHRFALRPAASIHVSLHKGGSARPIPVELFLTCVADVEGAPEFLMGIRETFSSLPREACTDAPGAVALQLIAVSEVAPEPGPDAAQVGAARLGPRALAPTLAPLAVEQVRSPASATAHWQLARNKALADSRSSISSSSRASSSSAGSCAPAATCVSSVCLRVVSATRGLRVEDMLLRFEAGHQQPRLKNWLPKESLDHIVRKSEELVNERWHGDGEEAVAGIGLGPMRFSSNGYTFLMAESAELVANDPVVEPCDSSEASDYFNPIVYMKLTGVSRLRMPWQSAPQKVSRSLHTIDESVMDAACDGDAPALRKRTSSLNNIAGRESA